MNHNFDKLTNEETNIIFSDLNEEKIKDESRESLSADDKLRLLRNAVLAAKASL